MRDTGLGGRHPVGSHGTVILFNSLAMVLVLRLPNE